MAIQQSKVKISERGYVKNHNFKGTEEAYEIYKRMGDNIIVHFDPDVDGVIAGFIVCLFLAKHGKKFSWHINSNRSHDWGIPLESIVGRDIIAVDFIVTREKIEELSNNGCKVISIDHHKNGNSFIKDRDCLVINNQYNFEDEDGRYLSGAGVVFEVLRQWDEEFDTLVNRQLVAITLLSDIRDIENPLAEGYLYNLYSAKYKGFIKFLIDSTMGGKDYGFGLPRLDRNYVDYKLSPAINACLRFNMQDEVVEWILGGKPLDLQWVKEQKSLVKEITSKLKIVDLSNLRVCYFYEHDFVQYSDVLSNFVGLTASKNLDGERSVICYMIAYNQNNTPYIKRASFRGRINGLDYNKALSELYLCLGHGSAFGIKGIVPTPKTFTTSNNICTEVEESSGYSPRIVNIANLSLFVSSGAFAIAEDNMYKLSQNQVMINYTGNNIRVKREGGAFREYEIDSIPVMSFDLTLNPKNCLITPVLDRGLLTFYLE